jgi:metal-responsive CopG/Arc/MetJ family transcriptional regulator
MKKSISVTHSQYGDPITTVRLPRELTKALDMWAKTRELSRSEAIRRLIENGLELSGDRVAELEAELKRARQQLAAVRRAAEQIVKTAGSAKDHR